jgi:hypothetical protein
MDNILIFENDVNTMKNIVKEFIAKCELSQIVKKNVLLQSKSARIK